MKTSNIGVAGIKQYFYNFLEFSKENESCKGCLVTNTINELGKDADPLILDQLEQFLLEIKILFELNLRQQQQINEVEIARQADVLLISIFGLASAARVFAQAQLSNYIENIFMNL